MKKYIDHLCCLLTLSLLFMVYGCTDNVIDESTAENVEINKENILLTASQNQTPKSRILDSSFNENEIHELQRFVSNIGDGLKEQYDQAFLVWVEAYESLIDPISSIRTSPTQMSELNMIREMTKDNPELLYLIMERYREDPNLYTRTMVCEIVMNYNSEMISLSRKVLQDITEKTYTYDLDGVYVVFSDDTFPMEFIKAVLADPSAYIKN
ncbi:MAG: hypothetical protein J5757_01845 [Lachnospiraceae bacterium]|nr:hypothetical protein [Lachnospiraceae bacterium]